MTSVFHSLGRILGDEEVGGVSHTQYALQAQQTPRFGENMAPILL